jgi:hypothetical protein
MCNCVRSGPVPCRWRATEACPLDVMHGHASAALLMLVGHSG